MGSGRGHIAPRVRALGLHVWLPVVVVALWWLLSEGTTSVFFPSLSTIMSHFRALWLFADVGTDVVPSLRNLVLGLAVALLAGVGLGVVLGLWRGAELVVDPFLQFMRAMPAIALLPLFLVLMGTGDVEKILVIGNGAMWPILLNTTDGIRGIDPEVRRVARSYRITHWQYLRRVILPGALSQMTIGFRTSLSIGVVLMVGSELYAATRGIGYFVLQSESSFNVADMWAGILLLGIIGFLINLAYDALERRLLRWREPA